MRKTLKVLVAVVCVLLALAVALLIYLEFGKPDGSGSSEPTPTGVVTSTEEGGATGTEGTETVESTESTEEAPLETREGGIPNYDFSNDEMPSDSVPEESGASDATNPYVPDDDELPQMPI